MNKYGYSAQNIDNGTTLRDTYPTAMGSSTAQLSSGATPGQPGRATGAMPMQNDEVTDAAMIGGQVNPLIGGLIFIALVFGLMFLAKRLGPDDDVKSLKPSVYNVVTVSFAAACGLPLLKFAAVKFKIPGVSTWILAA